MKTQFTYSSNYIDEVKSCSHFKINVKNVELSKLISKL